MQDRKAFERTSHVLNSKLRKYLIPTIATELAMSLDEFVDSIIVANMLGLKAMTVVGVASPIVLVIAATYILFGIGGSTLYAFNIGQRDTKKAGKILAIAFSSAMLVSLLVCFIGLFALEPISAFLCGEESMQADLMNYLRVLFISAPFIIGIQTITAFLPAAGLPNIATLVCLIANATNLTFDYIYIRFFDLGVAGTACATLTGYVFCLIMFIVLILRKKIRLYVTKPHIKDFRNLRGIVGQGGANALGQVGYTIKFTFYNHITLSVGGTVALQVFSVVKQILSIMSIGLAGVADAAGPFMATLKGQKDNKGIRFVLKSSMLISTLISGALVLLFEVFPELLYKMFNVTDPAVISVATTAVRIFLVMFLVRGIYMLFMGYARIIERKTYAMAISLLDGFVLLIPVALLCKELFGLNGIWASFPVNSALLLLGMVLYNTILAKKSDGALEGLFLIPNEDGVKIYDMTITPENETISEMSESLIAFCRENGVKKENAQNIGLIAEEMALYTRLHRKKNENIDILVRIMDDSVTMDFRSEGLPFNPLAKSEEDSEENIALINRVPSEVVYNYILGMNSTKFTVKKA